MVVIIVNISERMAEVESVCAEIYCQYEKSEKNMENAYMADAEFIDRKTIRLTEEYPFKIREIRLIIIPEKILPKKRKAGILKGKIRMSEDFNELCSDKN